MRVLICYDVVFSEYDDYILLFFLVLFSCLGFSLLVFSLGLSFSCLSFILSCLL
eukprot:m.269484 g.269484  ORF g.269484 m.269484 type:complete len:54 (+) comp42377_c0_seq1:154-315(+)